MSKIPRSSGIPRVKSTGSRVSVGGARSTSRIGLPIAQSTATKSRPSSAKAQLCIDPTCANRPPGRPSQSGACDNPTCVGQSSSTQVQKLTVKKDEKKVARQVVKKKEERKCPPKEYELPPLSVLLPKKKVDEEFEKLKAKTRRRHAPEGEDMKGIKECLKGMVDQEVTVHEFVGAISEFTADNGTTLRTILANELSHFRTMARRVYDTMTQDISDVLINEHVQLARASKERHAQYTDKMMRAIDEIYESAPEFSFEKFYTERGYLDRIFPLAVDFKMDEETEAMQMRQEAYHRLMWLRSEADRLNEENKRLANRLKELKQRQKDQMKKASTIEKINEDKRKDLEKTQEDLEEQLEEMNTSIEKSLIEQEQAIRHRDEVNALKKKVEKRPIAMQVLKRQTEPPENWGTKTATEIEESHATEVLVSEVSRASMASSVGLPKRGARPSTGAVPKQLTKSRRKKYKFTTPKVQQDKDPFHYSPPRTPPGFQQRERSPFHFSPPKTPPETYLAATTGARMETTRVTTTTSQQQQRPAPPRMGRRGAAPRDSWGGF